MVLLTLKECLRVIRIVFATVDSYDEILPTVEKPHLMKMFHQTHKLVNGTQHHVDWNINKTITIFEGRKEENVLFNDTFNTFYFAVIWRRYYSGPLR